MEVSAAMVPTDSIKCAFHHEKALGMPPNPTSPENLVVPDEDQRDHQLTSKII